MIPFTFNWFDDPDHRMGAWVAFDDVNRALAGRWAAMIAQFARTGDPVGRSATVWTGAPAVA